MLTGCHSPPPSPSAGVQNNIIAIYVVGIIIGHNATRCSIGRRLGENAGCNVSEAHPGSKQGLVQVNGILALTGKGARKPEAPC